MEPEKDLGGRPPKHLDLAQIEELAALQCTYDEIAAVLGISKRQFIRRAKSKDVLEAIERGRERGRVSIRRAQFKRLESSDTMPIWLGKQYLGQRDVTATELSGPGGGPIEHDVSIESARDKIARALKAGSERIAARESDDEPAPQPLSAD